MFFGQFSNLDDRREARRAATPMEPGLEPSGGMAI
jgi:hypothetical protein